MRRALLALALAATPAAAQDTIAGDKFESLVEGRSLAWKTANLGTHGIERYYPGRRVTWFDSVTRTCLEGSWSVEGDKGDPAICFVYEDSAEQHCFRVWREGDALLAVGLDGGSLLQSDLGPEHDIEFGCEYLGM